jgi:hypothetical protein
MGTGGYLAAFSEVCDNALFHRSSVLITPRIEGIRAALTWASNQRTVEVERVFFLSFQKSLKLSQPPLKFS